MFLRPASRLLGLSREGGARSSYILQALARLSSSSGDAPPAQQDLAGQSLPSPPAQDVATPLQTHVPAEHIGHPQLGVAAVKVAPLPEDIVVTPADEPTAARNPRSRKPDKSTDTRAVELSKFPKFVSRAAEVTKGSQAVTVSEAIRQIKSHRRAKFDETVEVHVNLSVDPRRSDQVVRGAASLPWGTGKSVRVAVFADGAAAAEAKASGADVVGGIELIERIKESGGKLDFDKCVATPALMPKLGQVARILGPRGLMPNPKLGTVTNDVAGAVKAAKQGRVDFRADKGSVVHAGVGKMSFAEAALEENIGAFAAALLAAKPLGLKKSSKFSGYFTAVTLSSTMGPGIRVAIPSVASVADQFSKGS